MWSDFWPVYSCAILLVIVGAATFAYVWVDNRKNRRPPNQGNVE